MGITFREFQVAMETCCNRKIVSNGETSRYNNVKGIEFLHSGSNYIVQRGHKAPDEIMNRAMLEFGEVHPGEKNFWWGEIHSVKGFLTLVTMLEDKYSKELVNELANEIYKKVLDCSSIQSNVTSPIIFNSTRSLKIPQLCKSLKEYINIVNPFGNQNLKAKQPIEYLDKVNVQLRTAEHCSSLSLETKSLETNFYRNMNSWRYRSFVMVQKNRKNYRIHIIYSYNNGHDNKPVNELVFLHYYPTKMKGHLSNSHPEEIDLCINLKTGLAYKAYKQEQAQLATEEQINIIITHLKISIKRINNSIIHNMFEK